MANVSDERLALSGVLLIVWMIFLVGAYVGLLLARMGIAQ